MATLPPQKREVHHASSTYTFASRPRPVQARAKYRNKQNEGPLPYGNIMYDRRIVRGNTYAQNIIPTSAQPDPIEIQKEQEARRRLLARKKAKAQLRPKTPEAVEGRKHIDVQTELYLEELTDRVEEADVFTQTDAFLDRPPSPLFIPAKTGVDVATQILEGELFDFDIEVKPILEVLVGKTMEQALLEVMEEEELSNLRAQQRRFEEMRNAELVETQRLEEQERRHREEKDRRRKQQIEVRKLEKETTEKIAARAFAQSYLHDLVPSVFGTLSEYGYFYDPVEREVENNFIPWLMSEVETEIDKTRVARGLLDSIIRNTVTARDISYMSLEEEVQRRIKVATRSLRLDSPEKTERQLAKPDHVDVPNEPLSTKTPATSGDAGAPAGENADVAVTDSLDERDTQAGKESESQEADGEEGKSDLA